MTKVNFENIKNEVYDRFYYPSLPYSLALNGVAYLILRPVTGIQNVFLGALCGLSSCSIYEHLHPRK